MPLRDFLQRPGPSIGWVLGSWVIIYFLAVFIGYKYGANSGSGDMNPAQGFNSSEAVGEKLAMIDEKISDIGNKISKNSSVNDPDMQLSSSSLDRLKSLEKERIEREMARKIDYIYMDTLSRQAQGR